MLVGNHRKARILRSILESTSALSPSRRLTRRSGGLSLGER
jgi:hypothetical protein